MVRFHCEKHNLYIRTGTVNGITMSITSTNTCAVVTSISCATNVHFVDARLCILQAMTNNHKGKDVYFTRSAADALFGRFRKYSKEISTFLKPEDDTCSQYILDVSKIRSDV